MSDVNASDALVRHAASPEHAAFLRETFAHFDALHRSARPPPASLALILGLVALGLFVIASVFVVLFAPLAVFPFFGGLIVGFSALVATGIERLWGLRRAEVRSFERDAVEVLAVRSSASGGGRLEICYAIDARRADGSTLALTGAAESAARLAPGLCGSAAWCMGPGGRGELVEFRPAR
ncbi:MAG: hypothetical protein FJ299_07700 [Planctomycetes bacterium]|nr:hypothetical protein [Planctomycetota bacterium]